jgi:hypothetical protein
MYNISKHAQQRYAERIMSKEGKGDIAVYISSNAEKICNDVNKMIDYGRLVYSGDTESSGQIHDVYMSDTWIVITDPKSQKVVTLYSIDLGVGDEFNKNYIKLLLERLDEAKERFAEKDKELSERVREWQAQIDENKEKITELRQTANGLEKANENLMVVINDYQIQRYAAEQEVREIVRTLTGKKIT